MPAEEKKIGSAKKSKQSSRKSSRLIIKQNKSSKGSKRSIFESGKVPLSFVESDKKEITPSSVSIVIQEPAVAKEQNSHV
jgi:hypothetical protein